MPRTRLLLRNLSLPCRILLAAVTGLSAVCASAGSLHVAATDKSGAPMANVAVHATPVGGALPPTVGTPERVTILQDHLQFSPYLTVVRVGASAVFPNNDKIEHHVKSMSPAKEFEFKIYDKGITPPPVVFDKPGVVVAYCMLHGWMRAYVLVVDTPYFAKTDEQGKARIDDLPEGTYQVKAWHPDMGSIKPPLAQTMRVTPTGVHEATLAFDFLPRKPRAPK